MTTGVFYILYEGPNIPPHPASASAEFHYRDLLDKIRVSIASLRAHCDLPITIYTTKELEIDADNICVQIVSPVTYSEDRNRLAPKLHYLASPPYDAAIFVDCDTKFFADPAILLPTSPWDFDLAICKETLCGSINHNWLNTGFMIINNGKPYQELIKIAAAKLNKHPQHHDQWAINQAYREMFDITVKILPQKWNVRDPVLSSIDDPCMIHSHRIK